MSPPRRSVGERRGSERPNYFFLAFLRFAAFFRFGAFFAAPFEAAALARLRLAFMRSSPLCRRNARDSMEVATESRMEMRENRGQQANLAVKIRKNGVGEQISREIHRRFPGESSALRSCAMRFASL
jgi:hypothetical protein